MQLSKKEKQALQEKIKEQRQAMWSGKQSTSQDSEETTADSQSDSSTTETADEETNQDESSVQTESEAEAAPIAEETGEQEEEEEPAREDERVFWEAGQEGGPSTLTWKLVLAVISVAIILVGVGVYLGFLFAS